MKKIIAILLVVSMVFMFVGCGKDSDKDTSSANQAPATSNLQNNTTVNQGETTTPPTTTAPSNGNTATITPPTSGYPFEKGSVNNSVYTNNWANLKVNVTDFGSTWSEVPASDYPTEDDTLNITYGFAAANMFGNSFMIGFQELTGNDANITETEYLKNIIADGQQSDSYTFSDIYDRTIGNTTYKAFDATAIEAAVHYSVRRLDNYMIIIAISTDTDSLPNLLNSIQTVR